jgi:hypothetical protein
LIVCPSVGLGIIVPAGAVYDRHHHWRNDAGQLRASLRFALGGYSDAHIQGDPTALRELAAALVDARTRPTHGRPSWRPQRPRGWLADVGRQP